MTEKDLHKLSREDLLKLLLEQSKELEATSQRSEEYRQSFLRSAAVLDKLKARLDQKDEQLKELQEKIEEKEKQLSLLFRHLQDIVQK